MVEYVGPEPGKVLEIGAGTGIVSAALHSAYEDVTHTDISEPALAVLKKRLGNVSAALADFCDMPYEDKTFDVAVGVGTYRYVTPDTKGTFWEEMRRIVKPGGRLMLAQFYPRGARLQGTDLVKDASEAKAMEGLFEPANVWQYTAKARLGRMAVRSGTYHTIEFARA